MDICHLKKNAELKPKFQKYEGRVALRGDIAKDDCGAYAVFFWTGLVCVQMSAANVMHVIARLQDCNGQVADAKSAYTRVKMEDAPKILRIPKSECPDVWIRLPRHAWPSTWSDIEDPVVPLERHRNGQPLAGLLWEKTVRKSSDGTWMGKSAGLGMSVCS